jgi:hypothetical protein
MLQIDHIYEFFYNVLFNKNCEIHCLPSGVPKLGPVNTNDITVFTPDVFVTKKIFFYDQEPVLSNIVSKYLDVFQHLDKYSLEELKLLDNTPEHVHLANLDNPQRVYKNPAIIAVSEHSEQVNLLIKKYNLKLLYYFFHGFAALDWYRGYYALNCNKVIVKQYKHDFITFNRLITEDRSYRIYFVSQLSKHDLIDKGLVSFGVTDDKQNWRDEVEQNTNSKLSQHAQKEIWNVLPDMPNRLYVDGDNILGSASTNIPRSYSFTSAEPAPSTEDALWHIVTETVFYYPKLHLTEKIFKPIVSKQPFMLLAAPGNLEYLRSYGFKTFDGIIDESYDKIEDNDARIDAVVAQMKWYCNLSQEEKSRVIERLAPIVEYNFQHFYGKFKEIITDELLENTKTLFKEIEYDDSQTDYDVIRKVLTN